MGWGTSLAANGKNKKSLGQDLNSLEGLIYKPRVGIFSCRILSSIEFFVSFEALEARAVSCEQIYWFDTSPSMSLPLGAANVDVKC